MTYDKWKTDPDDIKDRFERGEDEREELYADLERLRSINADLLAAAEKAAFVLDEYPRWGGLAEALRSAIAAAEKPTP